MNADQLKDLILEKLEDIKARDVSVLNVQEMTGVTDYMIVCSGTSNRHVKSVASFVEVEIKKAGIRPLGVEGEKEAEWVLVDFADVVLHVMLPEAREFYDIERLWNVTSGARAEAEQAAANEDSDEAEG